jgi:hypothetical protein
MSRLIEYSDDCSATQSIAKKGFYVSSLKVFYIPIFIPLVKGELMMIDQAILASATPLQSTYTTLRQIQAEFLQGPITTGFRGKASGILAMLVAGPQRGHIDHARNSSINICPSDLCGSDWTGHTLCCTHAGCGGGGGGITDDCGVTDPINCD